MPEWCQFASDLLDLKCQPSALWIFRTMHLAMNVTDGFQSKVADIDIPVSVSPMWVITLILQILGPVGSIVAVMKNRYIFYMFFMKSYYKFYRPINIYVGEDFVVEVPFMNG